MLKFLERDLGLSLLTGNCYSEVVINTGLSAIHRKCIFNQIYFPNTIILFVFFTFFIHRKPPFPCLGLDTLSTLPYG